VTGVGRASSATAGLVCVPNAVGSRSSCQARAHPLSPVMTAPIVYVFCDCRYDAHSVVKICHARVGFRRNAPELNVSSQRDRIRELTDGYWQVWIYDVDTGAQRSYSTPTRRAGERTETWCSSQMAVHFFSDSGREGGKSSCAQLAAVDLRCSSHGERIAFAHLRTDVHDTSAIWRARPRRLAARARAGRPAVHPFGHPTASGSPTSTHAGIRALTSGASR
jgi:hypothetical protein